ncbi:hypothetical protein E4665_02565 [Sporolactobacillus shoreae]|uniref:Bacterial Ig domain-containing protein n=1 Tax=Sporolactobacillus shoreae TaxID=1465501 RepID=A0A4Z0GRA3_9BACL|nr:Ig-like domain-containing protein [Sporolactobacillus shoreae]TGA99849.1 hypothetical protein E4665_02565 [Sporolactobacillus shoreae]
MSKLKKFSAMLIASLVIFSFSAGVIPVGQARAQTTTVPVLISNESTDGNSTVSGIVFDRRSGGRTDYVKPFTPPAVTNNLFRKNSLLRSVSKSEQMGATRTFYVSNLSTNLYYTEKATLEYVGTHADVWVGDSQLTSADAAKLGQEFDNKIYASDVNNFGDPSDVDRNGKVEILCYDIQDGFNLDSGGAYDAGYFDPRDLFPIEDSNQSEIFYIDTNPSMGTGPVKDVSEAYTTLAHEFQHMINFNQKVFVQNGAPMDTWMNEGLSMAAEQIYSGSPELDQIDNYNSDENIADGQSLLYWDYSGDTIANYALSYLFMEYLRIQSGQGNSIYKQLIDDPHSDYLAVQDLIHKYIDPKMSFGTFMNDFRIALYLKRSTGRFGFHNEPGFQALKSLTDTDSSSLSLRGGGAIVKWMNPSSIPKQPAKGITYTNLDNGQLYDTTPPAVPGVSPVANNNTSVSGTAEKNSVITITTGGQQIGIGNTDGLGRYTVKILAQRAGTWLAVSATDAAGNESGTKSVRVMQQSRALSSSQVKVANNHGRSDAIYISHLQNGSVIRLYDARKHWIKTQTVKGNSTALYVRQLGSRSGDIYVSITQPYMGTSNWTKIYFSGEVSGTLSSSQIKVYNYRYHDDQVRVYRITKGDYIKVYNSRKRLIARKTSTGRSTILYIRQLGKGAGRVYVTVTHFHMRESGMKRVGYRRE